MEKQGQGGGLEGVGVDAGFLQARLDMAGQLLRGPGLEAEAKAQESKQGRVDAHLQAGLLPRLQMGINAPLLARLSFCLRLQPWSAQELTGYVQARLQEAGIHANPFEAAALTLLLQAGNGLPRLLNHLAQRSLEEAAAQNSRAITAAHVQRALELLPWVAQLAR